MAYRNVARFDATKWATFIGLFRLCSVPTYTMPNPRPLSFDATRWKKIIKVIGI
jgi:hypothetical protein